MLGQQRDDRTTTVLRIGRALDEPGLLDVGDHPADRRQLDELAQAFLHRLGVRGVTPAADGAFTLSGTFTAVGRAHPLELVGTVAATTPDTVTVNAEGDLDRTQWGLGWTKMGAGVHNHLSVSAVFTRS